MHGRIKTRTTEEQRLIKKKERENKVRCYQAVFKRFLEKRSSGIYDEDGLEITSSLLSANPDIITLWNYRREVFLHLKTPLGEENLQNLLEKDLNLTEQCLKVNPKSYGSWHHRIWVLEFMPKPNWKRELALCTRYLEMDERNFHGWDYRRVVAEKCKVPDIHEYEYTLQKINTNFSNYSAWHLRSKLLPKLFPDTELKLPIAEDTHKEELDLVKNAAFTDPNDQSAWFYQRWLLGLTDPKVKFTAVDIRGDMARVSFSKRIRRGEVSVTVLVDSAPVAGTWANQADVATFTWMFTFESKIPPATMMTLRLLEHSQQVDEVTVPCGKLVLQRPSFTTSLSAALSEALEAALEECLILLDLEPNSKWALLASVWIMRALDQTHHQHSILTTLGKLQEVDPLRRNYYNDMASKINIEVALIQFHDGSTRQPHGSFELRHCGLTCLCHLQYLMTVESVALDGNRLRGAALRNLDLLVACKALNLEDNTISSLDDIPSMPALEVLSLSGNQFTSTDSFNSLGRFPRLKQLVLKRNPVSCTDDLKHIAKLYPGITICDS